MFEVNGTYANRKGNYTVLSLDGDRMTIRYEDGSEANLKISLQERIWENIEVERQAAAAKTVKRPKKSVSGTNFYIKTVSISEEHSLNLIGLQRRRAATVPNSGITQGDRLIYFAVEPQLFIAVATITAKPKKGKAIDYLFGDGENPKAKVDAHPIDIDAHIEKAEMAIPVDASELESLPNHAETLTVPHKYFAINEDDFELLAELIMEVGESEDAAIDDSDIAPEEELEMDMDG